jgi:hypothetical protein
MVQKGKATNMRAEPKTTQLTPRLAGELFPANRKKPEKARTTRKTNRQEAIV